MKKNIKLLSFVLLLIIGVFTLTGCGDKEKNKNKESNETKDEIEIKLLTEGYGQLSYYLSDKAKIDFSDEKPSHKIFIKTAPNYPITIDAKADDGYVFIMWKLGGKEYSSESRITVTLSEDTTLTAVFG